MTSAWPISRRRGVPCGGTIASRATRRQSNPSRIPPICSITLFHHSVPSLCSITLFHHSATPEHKPNPTTPPHHPATPRHKTSSSWNNPDTPATFRRPFSHRLDKSPAYPSPTRLEHPVNGWKRTPIHRPNNGIIQRLGENGRPDTAQTTKLSSEWENQDF